MEEYRRFIWEFKGKTFQKNNTGESRV